MQLSKLFQRKLKVSTVWLLLLAFVSTSVGLYHYFPSVQALIGGKTNGGTASFGAGKTVRQPAPIGSAAHAYYPFDGNANNAVINNQNNLTDTNTVTQANTKNLAGSFASASSEYLSITDNTSVSTGDIDFTFATWVYFNSVGVNQSVLSKDTLSTSPREYNLYFSGATNKINFYVFNGVTTQIGLATADNAGALTTGKWYYIVAWHSATSNQVGIQVNNGTPNTASTTGAAGDGAAAFEIGRNASGHYLNGRVDSVGFWKKTLSSGEKDFLYNGGRGQGYANVSNYSGLTTSLTAWWNLDEASGTRNDSVGSNHLTDNNTVGSNTGIVGLSTGEAGQFTASATEYLTIADNEALSTGATSFTLAAWVYMDTKPTFGRIASKWGAAGSNATLEYSLEYVGGATDRFRFAVGNSTSYLYAQADTLGAPILQRWYSLVGYYDSSTSKVYISVNNGTADEAAFTGTPRDGTAGFSIGRPGDYNGDYWDGRIDEVAFWKRSLTSAEKTSLYNGAQGTAYGTLSSTLKTNLYGWWSLNEPSGNRSDNHRYAKYNATGNGATGTNNTPQLTSSGKFKQGYNFDGTDDYFVTPTGIDLGGTNKAAVSMWFYPTDNSDTAQTLFTWVPSANNGVQVDWRNTTTVNCYIGIGGWGVASYASSNVALNQWHHLACVYDGSLGSNQISLYIDGISVANGTQAGGSITSNTSTAAYIGNYNTSFTSFGFIGNIDDVRVHTSSLSGSDVTALYGGSNPPACDQSCVGWWKLDEASSSAADAIGSGTGTITSVTQNSEGVYNGGAKFNGSSSSVSIADNTTTDGLSAMTVSAWVNVGSDHNGMVVTKTDGTDGWYLYARLSGSDAFRFGMNNGGASVNVDWSYGSGFPTGWHLFTGVWDGSNMYLYWDGVLKAQGALSGGTTSNTAHPIYIGRMDSVSPLYFNGSVDDVRIYNRSLTTYEVYDQYTSGRP